ncbi:S8 family serine peptidase [Cytophagaceae bacterium YF14B1]|uniref:S8 family serine peptidase n=1 Tax=Xanthocytophaga flava TaxID=3048013 RepID=A0AAE3QS85_9BACT|nr:PKD domain-containing protein [Xanthocytophaga flavus]MDJ1484492.1 S8 family serine peptidase [Xanthocytophaga flavus]
MKTKILLITLCLWFIQGQLFAQTRHFTLDRSLKRTDYAAHTVVVKLRSTTSANSRTIQPSPKTNGTIQKLGVSEIKKFFPTQQSTSTSKARLRNGQSFVDLSTIYQIELPEKQDLESAINTLLSDSTIEYAEPLYTGYQPLYTPNDPLITTGAQYALKNIKAYEAWDIHKGSPDVLIGIIDYGFDVTHEDIKNKIHYNTADPVDGIDNDKDGYTDNYAGWNIIQNSTNLAANNHGTRVAGCAAGQADNGLGIAGVALNCPFIPVTGYDPYTGGFAGYAGLVYLAEKGCKVINLSWGRVGPASSLEQDVINYAAINHDAVICASAGNEGSKVSRYWWPASYDNVISVAATGSSDLRWGTQGGSAFNDKVDLAAPGQDIVSSVDGNSYNYDSGTSYSSPIVAGAAALVRSMYPELSATEVAQRLIATTDDIYNLAGNSEYIGMLGSGRLNVYKALTATVTKAITLTGISNTNAKKQPYLLSGITNELTVNIKNIASPLTNAQISLTSNSSYITISNPTIAFGAVATGASIANTSPFQITIGSDVPANTEVTFTATVTDVSYTRSFSWTTFINPDYLDIDINKTKITTTSNGRLGFSDAYSFWSSGIAANQQAKGNGIRVQNQQLLFEAGLIVATDESHVSDCIRNEATEYNTNQHFESVRNVDFQDYKLTDILTGGIIQENWYKENRIGVEIQHQTYAWKDAPNDQFVIIEYKITNKSGSKLDSLYTGLFADWEIGNRKQNQAGWDSGRKLGYAFNPSGSFPYAGIRLLTEQMPNYYAFDNTSGINVFDGFSNTEKFQAISGGVGRAQTATTTDDIAHMLAAKIEHLADGDSIVVAFAILGGSNLADLQKSADAALTKFIEINRSPKPVIANVTTCRGTKVMLTPSPGQTFKFYQKQADGTLKALSVGSELEIDHVEQDTTFFVTNADSLYESDPVAVSVNIFESRFKINKDSLGIADQDVLQVTNMTSDAVKWLWNFGDGTTSTEQNPAHTYTKQGDYRITLISENAKGCQDSVAQVIKVFPGILSPKPIVQPVSICAGDSVVLRPSNGTVYGLYSTKFDLLAVGTSFNLGRIYKDTIFYVTASDYIVESDPVIVTIKILHIDAGFSINKDTLDLTLNEMLKVTDSSRNAVKWLWDFGDGTTSTEQNPAHTFTKQGTYIVSLQATNINGCIDMYSDTIQVTRTNIANFSINKDTLDLTLNEMLKVTDSSRNAVKWLWDFGDGTTSTEQNPAHTFTKQGTYIVSLQATNTVGNSDTLSKKLIVIGNTNQLADAIKVSPNPTTSFINIIRSVGLTIEKVKMQIYNSAGTKVYETINIPYESQFDFSTFSKGLYIIIFSGDNQQLVKKIIVN